MAHRMAIVCTAAAGARLPLMAAARVAFEKRFLHQIAHVNVALSLSLSCVVLYRQTMVTTANERFRDEYHDRTLNRM